jgi:flagellar basal-body rod modification protein FlgD
VDSVSAVSQAGAQVPAETNRNQQKQIFGTDLFLQLLVAQLRYQDPMSGSQDTGQMITQMTLFTLLEQVVKLQQTVELQSRAQEQFNALNLLNSKVTVVGADGSEVSGIVTAIHYDDNTPYLTVQGADYPLSAVIRVGVDSSPGEGDE